MGWNCTIAVVDGATLDDLAGIGWRVTGVTLDWETATTLDNEGVAAWVQDERVVIASGGLELQEQAERLSAVGPVCSALFQSVTDTYEWRMVGPDRRRTWAWSAYELQVDEGEPHPAETDVDRLDEDALFDLLTGVAGLRFDEELEGARFVVLELPGTPEPPAPTKRRRLFGSGLTTYARDVPTADDFLALARSSPWRFTALHFRHRDPDREVEAWLRRPGDLTVRHPEHGDTHETHAPYSGGWVSVSDHAVSQPVPVEAQDAVPQLRPDGLVARRPDDPAVEYDDPMYDDYQWVAMLDPVELSHHVTVADVEAGERLGRPVWRARVWAAPGYEPRCGCCALLWSEISEVDEQVIGGPTVRAEKPDVVYPDGWHVALDVGTGVVVELRPAGPAHADHADRWFEVDVLAVDDGVPATS